MCAAPPAEREGDPTMADTMAVRVVDADSHLTEPPDLWTSNLPAKWRQFAPVTGTDPATGVTRWKLADRWLFGPGSVSHAGWKEFSPSRPPTWEDIDVACYDADERTKWMDQHGVYAQVLYPNLVAFEGHAIMALEDPAARNAIVRVYNDYLSDFAGRAPGRFIPMAGLPFWDLDESIAEMRRCADLGHKGVLWAATLARHGLPASTDPYWDPFYAEAQELGLSVNFHVGVGWTEEDYKNTVRHGAKFDVRVQTGRTALGCLSNAQTISDLILQGVCERFPRLNFVSVESGFGWIPYVLESLDWNWRNYNGPSVIGGLLPSEYFRRQIYGMFWFEESTYSLFEQYQDNIMFETDFPHTTSLSPGPGSVAPSALEVIARVKSALKPATFEKVMWGNAARVYRLEH
jgi:predicted TIM-barrel fold metal-dependent hydrolase